MSDSEIHFAMGETPLGWLLLARREAGVCRLGFADEPRRLLHELEAERGSGPLREDTDGLAPLLSRLREFVEGRGGLPRPPLDLVGSDFQRLVWAAICEIPPGATRSYAELAARVARPRAWRAVAGACAANPVALLVPCHRVVPRSGALGGYRYGAWRKGALLALEARTQGAPLTAMANSLAAPPSPSLTLSRRVREPFTA